MTHPLLPTAQEAVLTATWGVDANSTSSPEGLVRHAPLEIGPLPQLMSSGIVRSQVRRQIRHPKGCCDKRRPPPVIILDMLRQAEA